MSHSFGPVRRSQSRSPDNGDLRLYVVHGMYEKNFRVFIVFVGFEVFTAVVMKSTILWGITPRSPLKVNQVKPGGK
jgi:hypothetical protein